MLRATDRLNNGSGVLRPSDSLKLIYRNQIKVHYPNVTIAGNENYYSYDKQLDLSQGGIVYPFTGIRGDAKELY